MMTSSTILPFRPRRHASCSLLTLTEKVSHPYTLSHRRRIMNWDQVKGNWKQFQGKVKQKWGKLTDDDLTMINGRREELEGKIQDRYGYSRDQIRKEVDDWLKTTS